MKIGKYSLVFAMVVLLIFNLVACSSSSTLDPEEEFTTSTSLITGQNLGSSMFIIIEENLPNDYLIAYHKDTKVMYAVSQGSYNYGNFTLLVNADGTPMTYKGY